MDSYVSHKKRKDKATLLGFVGFQEMEEARRAIKSLNGVTIKDCKVTINLAAYGRKQEVKHGRQNVMNKGTKSACIHSLRDNRSFKEVLKVHPGKRETKGARMKQGKWSFIRVGSSVTIEAVKRNQKTQCLFKEKHARRRWSGQVEVVLELCLSQQSWKQ